MWVPIPPLTNPPLAITMGDPAGVGPEIVCMALAQLTPEQRANVVVIGNRGFLEKAAGVCAVRLGFCDGDSNGDFVRVFDLPTSDIQSVRPGVASAAGGEAAFRYVEHAVKLSQSQQVSTIVTAPLNKEALHAAGHKFDGHTGMLQHLTQAPSSFMLLAGDRLSTIHVSTHVSLQDAIVRTKRKRIVETIVAGVDHLRRLGLPQPRLAVAGLNPHAGEGGMFGRQEIDEIAPAVTEAKAMGYTVTGPLPPDSVFLRAAKGEFDLVVAMYHDQGHIPTKLLAFDTTVNVSLGLPLQRTSVDHGTAFDIAWKGIVRPDNMVAALNYAWRLAVADVRQGT